MLNPKIKLLQLRKLIHSPGLIIKLDGLLLSKRGTRTKKYTNHVVNQIHHAVDEFKWLAPPRARMSVSFRFFSDQHNPPEIYRLIKYYLDLMQGPVFKDDRQVQYIDASIWRSDSKGEDSSSCLYIYVRRLSESLRLIDLCKESDVFNESYNNPIIYHHLIEKQYYEDAEKQLILLRSNRIMPYDVPCRKNPFLKDFVCDFNKWHPLVFDFGPLPNRGRSEIFKKTIESFLSKLVSSHFNYKKILIPIEYDVQVPKTCFNLEKDLDNIMITICSETKKHLLHPKLFINGYRIYVADKLDPNKESGLLVKLLPPGEIESYNNRIRKAIDSLEDDLIAECD